MKKTRKIKQIEGERVQVTKKIILMIEKVHTIINTMTIRNTLGKFRIVVITVIKWRDKPFIYHHTKSSFCRKVGPVIIINMLIV